MLPCVSRDVALQSMAASRIISLKMPSLKSDFEDIKP